MINARTTVQDIINDKDFENFGRLLFPVDRAITNDMTLEDISTPNVYIWYSHIKVNKTVEIINSLKKRTQNGEKVFYDIYTEREKMLDPSKRDTGLFFFKGKDNAPFAICNAGGGFMYVGAMHDSFPHALEISKRGYNAFALIYRVDHPYEDLARAISYIYDHSQELKVDKRNYSLWGGSAGARMSAELGNKSALAHFVGTDIPQAKAVIMQYTGYSRISHEDAPTYACVGTNDSIAYYRTMEERLHRLQQFGIQTECHVYKGLRHGFGLGIGTIAEGWINDAISFWENQIKEMIFNKY